MGWGLALAFAFFWIQVLVYIGSVQGCENVDPGSRRSGVCDVFSPWGRIWVLAGAPALVVVGGLWGQRRGRIRFLLAALVVALLVGTALPLIALYATSTR